MNNKLDWNDYEIVLKVADAGSLSKAARLTGLSHPTVFRRLNAVEEKLGVRLFERFRTGYQPTAACEELVVTARQIAELTINTERRLAGQDLRPSGVVRVATTDTLLHGLLAHEVLRFRKVEPEITLDFSVSNEIKDLSLREADIAIRPASSPKEHLVGKKLGTIRQAVFAHRSLGLENTSLTQFRDISWIGPSPLMPYSQLHAWMQEKDYDEECNCRFDSVLAMFTAVKTGLGVAVLPCYLADSEPGLVQLGETIDDVAVDLWLLTHADLRRTARVRAALDHFGTLGAQL